MKDVEKNKPVMFGRYKKVYVIDWLKIRKQQRLKKKEAKISHNEKVYK